MRKGSKLQFTKLHSECVEEEQPSSQGAVQIEQDFQGFGRLNAADDPGKNAKVELLSGLAGRPLTGLAGLKDARAELMRFRIKLVYDGDDWLIKRVDWSRARLSDFLRAASE